ncbi:MAG: M23 family metallopeptidase, partial [Bacteroidota bacterium]|nr:M23 family metallopeptidase [Bacteroidota bacterium]
PKYKYYYDQETLSYRRIEVNTGVRFRNAFVFLTVSALFGLIMLLVLLSSPLIETPKEIAQAREIDNYQLQYEQLNRKMQQIESVLDNLQDRDNQIYRVIFEANPISEDVRKAGFGGVNRYANLEGFENSELVVSTTKRMEILSKQVVVQSKSLDEIQRMALDKEVLLSAIPSIQPINNEDLRRMASGYGWRTDPFTKTRRKHKGMDFSAPTGTPIYATSDGKVIRVDGRAPGYGKHIRIDHGFGYVTLYAHLSKYNVRRGQEVKRGDVIGFVGNTGRSVAPHLHYEIRKDGVAVNPINFYYGDLNTEEFNALLEAANRENQSLD